MALKSFAKIARSDPLFGTAVPVGHICGCPTGYRRSTVARAAPKLGSVTAPSRLGAETFIGVRVGSGFLRLCLRELDHQSALNHDHDTNARRRVTESRAASEPSELRHVVKPHEETSETHPTRWGLFCRPRPTSRRRSLVATRPARASLAIRRLDVDLQFAQVLVTADRSEWVSRTNVRRQRFGRTKAPVIGTLPPTHREEKNSGKHAFFCKLRNAKRG